MTIRTMLLPLLLWATLATGQTQGQLQPAGIEARVMQVAEELRCLVCQNETIAASQSGLAVDLRAQIRSQLQQGRSEAEIIDFMVERYGAFVRYRPAFDASTALLWLGPFHKAFFDLIYTITGALGLGEVSIQVGHALFQWWSDLL